MQEKISSNRPRPVNRNTDVCGVKFTMMSRASTIGIDGENQYIMLDIEIG